MTTSLVEIDTGMQHVLAPRLTAGAPFIKIYIMLAPETDRAHAERTVATSPARSGG